MLPACIDKISAATAVIHLPSLLVLLAAMAVATAAPVSIGTPLEHALSSVEPSLVSDWLRRSGLTLRRLSAQQRTPL